MVFKKFYVLVCKHNNLLFHCYFKIVLASLTVGVRAFIFVPWVIFSPQNAVIAFSVAQITANVCYSGG